MYVVNVLKAIKLSLLTVAQTSLLTLYHGKLLLSIELIQS